MRKEGGALQEWRQREQHCSREDCCGIEEAETLLSLRLPAIANSGGKGLELEVRRACRAEREGQGGMILEACDVNLRSCHPVRCMLCDCCLDKAVRYMERLFQAQVPGHGRLVVASKDLPSFLASFSVQNRLCVTRKGSLACAWDECRSAGLGDIQPSPGSERTRERWAC